MPTTRLALLSLHQRSSSIEEREGLASSALEATPRPDVVALLTCHRVELYACIPATHDARRSFAGLLHADESALASAHVSTDGDAALHLFHASLGLDSVIVGEGQIANQVRRAYEAARAHGTDPVLAAVFQRALHLARTVRATTALGDVRRSVGSLAVDEALRGVADPLRATALVIGAGQIGKLAARALGRRVGRLLIATRDVVKARAFAASIGADAVDLVSLRDALARADVVIAAADTRGSLLTRELLAARALRRPLVVVDIAVPRSVAEDARALDGLVYRDVDDLVEKGASVAPEVIAEAERRCADEATSFMRWVDERERSGTIRALHERADAIRSRQLARALRHLGHLSERDRNVVASLAASLTHALIHEPTIRLRRLPRTDGAARALFGLDR